MSVLLAKAARTSASGRSAASAMSSSVTSFHGLAGELERGGEDAALGVADRTWRPPEQDRFRWHHIASKANVAAEA